ncbi:murein L,D-transpeptidase [Nocardioides pocheonensis]|uniref:Murein L,D-transpeptidase n=1 Tax=Nocardioides pocheonensis TaxID=661485 RepID=A0A3N0GW77_9ACTN|nr:murein L,D-transpeptidase [Nocardioides pocheonensis]
MEQRKGQDVPVNTGVKRGGGGTRFLVLLLAIAGLGYAATTVSASGATAGHGHRSAPAATVSPSTQPAAVAAGPQILPASDPLTPTPTTTPTPAPAPAVLQPGDTGPRVRVLQARLRQLGWYAGTVNDRYGPRTTTAVRGFQARHALPVTGSVDRPTLLQVWSLTRRPTRDELHNRTVGGQGGGGTWTTAALDRRCRSGHVLCVDKASRTIRWVVDGEVRRTMAVRFGAAYTPTREGVFHIGWKSRDHVSTLFHTSMPFAMFFSGGQAVHYSSDFAARGYAGASHGCVNVRDYNGIKWLFGQVRVGDTVVIYWS